MIAKPDVNTLIAGPLGQWLDEQALVREKAQELARSRWWKAAIIAGPLLAFLWILVPGWFQFNLFATIGAAALGYGWGQLPRSKAIKAVKVGINEAIAKALELQYQLNVVPGTSFELCQRYELVPSYDRSRFEDHWHGDVSGRSFALHEAHLKERRGSSKNQRYVTVFRGAVMTIDFSRRFHGTTLVERADQHRKLLGLGGRKDSVKFDGHQLDYVDVVHPDFEDEFCVFSDDQVEARYIVHPQYVERMIEVQKAFAGKGIRALFCGGELVIAIETENMFESGSIDAADDRSRIVRTVEQFASLANLAHALNEPERGSQSA